MFGELRSNIADYNRKLVRKLLIFRGVVKTGESISGGAKQMLGSSPTT
ncbi:hypothetical protein [Anaerotignum sp.]|nr:hypothetical protein [Anaerotignum sp.]